MMCRKEKKTSNERKELVPMQAQNFYLDMIVFELQKTLPRFTRKDGKKGTAKIT